MSSKPSVAVGGALGIALGLAASSPSGATVLTFDIVPRPRQHGSISQDYGDRVTATTMPGGPGSFGYGAAFGFTPNVVTSYTGGNSFWDTGYGDLTNIAFEDVDGRDFDGIIFTADPGFNVRLHGFDLGGWFHADWLIDAVTVFDGVGNVVFNQANVHVEGSSGHTSFDFGTPLQAQALRLFLDVSGLDQRSDDVGIDNIAFSQVVASPSVSIPEPASFGMLGAGLLGLAGLRRRRTG